MVPKTITPQYAERISKILVLSLLFLIFKGNFLIISGTEIDKHPLKICQIIIIFR